MLKESRKLLFLFITRRV